MDKEKEKELNEVTGKVIEILIRLAIVAGLVIWALKIISPFINPIVWGGILAVALFPMFNKVCARFGNKRKTVGTIFILLSVALLIVPSVMLVSQSIDAAQDLNEKWEDGELEIPPPNQEVKEWPVVGERTFTAWRNLSSNFQDTVKKYTPQIASIGKKVLGSVAGAGKDILGFTFSLIICGIMLIGGHGVTGFLKGLGTRIAGEAGAGLVDLATGTIRGVALGVVGTAIIQAILAAIGMVIMGIPLAAVWTLGVLMLAVIQLPPILILGPLAVYAFSSGDYGGVAATIFAIWCLVVSGMDGILKPILMGRNVEVPMLVILVGALGGMMLTGVMGLFVGAVVVALAYKLFMAWLGAGDDNDEEEADGEEDAAGDPGEPEPSGA